MRVVVSISLSRCLFILFMSHGDDGEAHAAAARIYSRFTSEESDRFHRSLLQSAEGQLWERDLDALILRAIEHRINSSGVTIKGGGVTRRPAGRHVHDATSSPPTLADSLDVDAIVAEVSQRAHASVPERARRDVCLEVLRVLQGLGQTDGSESTAGRPANL